MVDYRGSSSADTIDNRVLKLGGGDSIFGEGGDDYLISTTQITLSGGPGNDRIDGGGVALAAYWSAKSSVTVDLEAGYADDGEGGRDTLIGVIGIHGSDFADRFLGSSKNNVFWPLGGSANYIDGRAGEDLVILTSDPNRTTLKKIAPGNWTYTSDTGSGELHNVELLQFLNQGNWSEIFSLSGDTPRVVKPGEKQAIGASYSEIKTDFFKVTQFGFSEYVIQEAHQAYYYPKETDTHPAGSFGLDAHNMVTGDFNGDGFEDLAVIWVAFPHTVYRETPVYPVIYLNQGDGTLGPGNQIIEGPVPDRHMNYRAHAADFNGDGVDDLLIASMGIGFQNHPTPNADIREPITLLLSNGSGKLVDATKQIQGQEAGGVPEGYTFGHDLSVGDIDGDGDVDFYTNKVLMLNDGKGSFTLASPRLPAEARNPNSNVMSSAMGDLDGDGIDDLVVAYWENDARYAFLSNGKGFHDPKIIRLPDGPYGAANTKSNYMAIGDVTGDGRPDILIACTRVDPYYVGQYLQLFVNKGNGVFIEEEGRILNQPYDKHSGEGELYLRDMNGDGRIDIAHATGKTYDGQGVIAGGIDIFLNDGKGFFTAVDTSVYAYVAPNQLDGWGYFLSGAEGEFAPRMAPIKLSPGPGIDLIGTVQTPVYQGDHPRINQVTLFASEALKPLGRGVDEELIGTVNDDAFWGLDGNDTISGGIGEDTAHFSDSFADVSIGLEGNAIIVATKSEGIDRLTGIETLSFRDQSISSSSILRDKTPAQYRAQTNDGFVGTLGGAGSIIGTKGAQDVRVSDLVGQVNFDASFNGGGDIIRLPGNASDYTIARSGSAARLVSESLIITIPVGTKASTLSFDDGARSLIYSAGEFKIGAQAFGAQAASVSAPAERQLSEPAPSPGASAKVILYPNSQMTAGGEVTVIGTKAGQETVTLTGGKVTFDASFNAGGDRVNLPGIAKDYTATRSGSTIILFKGGDEYRIPIGTKGMDLAFGEDVRSLIFTHNSFMIGTQTISTNTALIG